ncbi:uncharacterized protein LOC142743511 isoform X3 [Rhinoderma darwinii]|uniref:uncharacterized protein LOC142743511 isoform X3 n=1 Tax=Rhinoderma darwinii TaxID=43563 RepID=UPI003F678DF6
MSSSSTEEQKAEISVWVSDNRDGRIGWKPGPDVSPKNHHERTYWMDPAEVRRSEHWRLLRRSLGPALADPWLWLSGGPFTASSIGSMSRLSLGSVVGQFWIRGLL